MNWAALLFALGTVSNLTPPLGPVITSVSPSVGRPAGGEVIRISGRNFQAPVRVLLGFEGGATQEAFVVDVSPTQVSFLTPAVSITAPAQAVDAALVVVAEAGTVREKYSRSAPFTFRNDTLTPYPQVLTPNTGPITGGRRVAIFGEGFQAPVQVLFGSNEARVLVVSYKEIIVEAPQMLDESIVDIHVRNVASGTAATLPDAFRYRPGMHIAQVFPTSGPETESTRVTIDGDGFEPPLSLSIGGVEASPVFVSGTRVVALTTPMKRTCRETTGPIVVTSVLDGDQSEAPASFTYTATQPRIVSIQPVRAVAGKVVRVTLLIDEGAGAQFTIGGVSATPLSSSTDGMLTTFVLPVPKTLAFPTGACPDGEARQLPFEASIVYTKRGTSCVARESLLVWPDFADRCRPEGPVR